MSTDTLDLPRIDADFDSAEPVRTEVAVAAAASIDFEKVDLAKLLIAKFGNWRPLVAKLKADNASTVHDLSTQTKVDEAVSLRNRTINMPLAEARRIDKALASVMSKARKKLGAELEEMEKGYDEAAQPLSKQIEDAQKKIDDDKEAKRLAEETRLNGLRANVDGVMARWLARCEVEGITAVRIGMGIGMLQELAMPPDVSDVAAHWTTAKAATLVSMRTLEREAAHREEEARLETQRAELARQRWEVLHQQMDVAFDAASLRAGAAAAEAVRDSFLTTHGHRAEWTEPNIGQAYVQAMNLLQPQPVEQKPEAVKLQFTAAMPAADAGTAAATESADREGGEPRAEPEAAPKFEEQQPQQVLKAEPATADATDRGTAADASPVGGPMGAGETRRRGPRWWRDGVRLGARPARAVCRPHGLRRHCHRRAARG